MTSLNPATGDMSAEDVKELKQWVPALNKVSKHAIFQVYREPNLKLGVVEFYVYYRESAIDPKKIVELLVPLEKFVKGSVTVSDVMLTWHGLAAERLLS